MIAKLVCSNRVGCHPHAPIRPSAATQGKRLFLCHILCSARKVVILSGANDECAHCMRTLDGVEEWGGEGVHRGLSTPSSSSPDRGWILPNTTPELAPILLILAILYAEFFEEVRCAFCLPKCVSLRAHSMRQVVIATTF